MLSLSKLTAVLGAALCAGAVSAQGSNSCASATSISGIGTYSFNSSSASTDGPSACGSIGRDIWFAWTATATDGFTFDTCTLTGFDSVLVAYDGASCPPGTQLACNDDTCGLQSEVSIAATAGNTYLIRIGSYNNSSGGSGILTVSQGATVTTCDTPIPGPDVIVGSVSDVGSYGGTGGISGFSLGTTSCNIGSDELDWIAGNAQHPVIAQNMYRHEEGRFEQIGQSWLKHGFTALQGDLCCDCTPSGTGSRLGVGCSDPYTAGLNGSQSGLGPRFQVNAHTGVFAYPYQGQGQSGNVIYKRIQVANADLDPALHPSATFYGEGHYIALDDATSGNGNNNASYRQMLVSSVGATSITMSMTGNTEREMPAIMAWQAEEPTVQIENVQVPDEGLFIVGSHATDNGDGTWHYEYAIQNLNSHASGGSFSVPVPTSLDVTNIGFHDVAYHSGEPFGGTDWTGIHAGGEVTWSTEDFAVNPNANALRWGTLYNFRFDANAAPAAGSATLGLFRAHSPGSVLVPVSAPDCGSLAASETVRAGTPANPTALLPGQTSGPVAGATWDPVIDHTSFFPSAMGDFLAVNPDGVQLNIPSDLGTFLCNVPSAALIFFSVPAGAAFSIPIPASCDLVGLSVCTQGGSFGADEFELTNALDVVIGSL